MAQYSKQHNKVYTIAFDSRTVEDLKYISKQNRTTQTLTGAVRFVISHYAQLLKQQEEVEKTGGHLVLIHRDTKGNDNLLQSRVDLRI